MRRRDFIHTLGISLATPIIAKASPDFSTGYHDSFQVVPTQITDMSVTQLAHLLRKRKVSSVEVVTAFAQRIDAVNPVLNAIVTLNIDDALKQAQAADIRIKKGEQHGILEGIPCTIKDSFDVKDVRSTAGTRGRENHYPTRDATVVERLRKAGAIILGKTNTPELTMEFFTDNPIFGATCNPYNQAFSPGGSSGGAAAIIAARGIPFDIGTDTGGSIRFPSHCCGVSGLKPTFGRVPRTGHILSYFGAPQMLTHVGPMARTIDDLDLLFKIITGPDNVDPYCFPVSYDGHQRVNLSSLRFGYLITNEIVKPDAAVEEAVRHVVEILTDKKFNVKEVNHPALQQTADLSEKLITSSDWLVRMLKQWGTDETSLHWAYEYASYTGSEYNRMLESIDRYKSEMLQLWSSIDVLICPVSPSTAQPLGTPYEGEPYYSYTSAFNLTGWPALSTPVMLSANGLPVGVQLVTPPWREDYLLALAKMLSSTIQPIAPPSI